MTFPELAHACRTRLGLTQAAAAALLGMSVRKLIDIESGELTPKPYEQAGIIKMYQDSLLGDLKE